MLTSGAPVFGHGFVSAGLTKGLTKHFTGIGGDAFNVGNINVMEVAIAATLGGTISDATGGKFANGAVTAAFANIFNEQGGGQMKRGAQRRAAEQELVQDENGRWVQAGSVKQGGKATFRLGHKIKIEGADDAASLHVNNAAYEVTFTEISESGAPLAGVYPTYEGVLSSGVANSLATDRVIELYGPPGTSFDWTLTVPHVPTSCDNCGTPMVNIYNWVEE